MVKELDEQSSAAEVMLSALSCHVPSLPFRQQMLPMILHGTLLQSKPVHHSRQQEKHMKGSQPGLPIAVQSEHLSIQWLGQTGRKCRSALGLGVFTFGW